jgi:hypothetical protein
MIFFLINTVFNKSEFGSHNQSVNGQHIFTRAKGFNRLGGLRNRNVKVIEHSYCNKFAGSISQWKFITLKVQYTTLDYGSQLF